ncbi:heavy-metal-associated domain-containing protein [Dongia deserti]|uniref:heavy-metal-associated domain-containing protein n=1 Tax=Dongia deserti TaxID=2268030 RepID=UPI0025486BA5|nr:cation transporter [Dongia deserti]
MLRSLILLPLLVLASTVQAAEQTVTLTVENMTCALCPVTVRTAMEDVPGVKDVRVDFESKTAVVVFDDLEASVEDIAEASRLAGYPAAPEE